MSDQGEKIIHLAREILSCEQKEGGFSPLREENNSRMIGVKTACLAACLAAAGGSVLTHYVDEMNRPVSRIERFEIDALFFYTSRENKIEDQDLRHEVQLSLDIKSLQNLSFGDYQRVRQFLWTKLQS